VFTVSDRQQAFGGTQEGADPVKWRRVLWWVLVVFAVYAVYRAPDQAADFVRTVGESLGKVVASIANFFDGLLR
jgi:hypothetical protein